MGKHFRIHAAIGILVFGIIVALTIVYFRYGIFRADRGLDLLLLALWAIIVILAIIVLRRRFSSREEIVRRFYLSEEGVFNHEIGYAPFTREEMGEGSLDFAVFAAVSLVNMSYGFEVADPPAEFAPVLIVTTEKLKFHRVGEGDDGGIVIDAWEGRMLHAAASAGSSDGSSDAALEGEVLGTYRSASELALLLDEHGDFF